eukprot:gene4154-5918_t
MKYDIPVAIKLLCKQLSLNTITIPFLLFIYLFNQKSVYGFTYIFQAARITNSFRPTLFYHSYRRKFRQSHIFEPFSMKLEQTKQIFWKAPDGLGLEIVVSYADEIKSEIQDFKNSNSTQTSNISNPLEWISKAYQNTFDFLTSISILNQVKNEPQLKSPLLFIHGSFHSSWCFTESFMGYFNSIGHDCYAISLRGTAPTGMLDINDEEDFDGPIEPSIIRKSASNSKMNKTVSIEQHVSDISTAIEKMYFGYNSSNLKPIIIAHSFGGLITMKLLEDENIRNMIGGAALLCSVPPSGNGDMTKRFLLRNFVNASKIVWGFVLKGVTTNVNLCKELFFDDTVPLEDINRYMTYFKEDSQVGLDLISLNNVLPSKTSMNLTDGGAIWLNQNDNNSFSRVVIGAENDFIVDYEGVVETAKYMRTEPIIISDVYHDVMLGTKWFKTARVIANWLNESQYG